MITETNEPILFDTLIAHGIEPSLDVASLQHHCHNTLIFTHTLGDTLTMINDRLYGLIILDLNIRALEILAIAKQPNALNLNTPIIALVDNLESNQAKNLISEGFDDCLTKPLTNEILNQLISNWQKKDGSAPFIVASQAILAKLKNNKKLTISLYLKLFEELPPQISDLENTLNNGDYKLAFDITHKLNGSVKTFYLQGIQELADALEMCLVQKNYNFADGYFLMLKQQISTFTGYRQLILEYLESTK